MTGVPGYIDIMANTDTITISEVTRSLGVTLMAVHQWRQGSTRRPPLPVSVARVGRAKRVTIYRADLGEWLSRWRPDLLPQLQREVV